VINVVAITTNVIAIATEYSGIVGVGVRLVVELRLDNEVGEGVVESVGVVEGDEIGVLVRVGEANVVGVGLSVGVGDCVGVAAGVGLEVKPAC
jgi:hypothetical protein